MRRFLLLAALLLTFPASAQAGWKLDRAQAIAARVWHSPCAGQVALQWTALPVEQVGAELDCTVSLPTGRHLPWVELCTTMIHEYGHAAGHRDPLNPAEPWHSHNPHSVMASNTVTVRSRGGGEWLYVGYDKRCGDRGRTYLGMKPSARAAHEEFTN